MVTSNSIPGVRDTINISFQAENSGTISPYFVRTSLANPASPNPCFTFQNTDSILSATDSTSLPHFDPLPLEPQLEQSPSSRLDDIFLDEGEFSMPVS